LTNLSCRCARQWSTARAAAFVIAHRLHTVSHADWYHVVEDGRVVNRPARELLRGGRSLFYRLQLKEQETRGPLAAVAS
jgi:ABC-type multidrug transport system fused ATPase/permease subunit